MEDNEQKAENKTSENKDNDNSKRNNEMILFSCESRIKEPYPDISYDRNRKK